MFPLYLACKKDSLTVRGRPYPPLEDVLLLSIEHLRAVRACRDVSGKE